MPATLTSSGTWTAIQTPSGEISKPSSALLPSNPNVPQLQDIAQADFRTPIDETNQIIQLVSNGYGISYWSALVFLQNQLQALQMKGAPTA